MRAVSNFMALHILHVAGLFDKTQTSWLVDEDDTVHVHHCENLETVLEFKPISFEDLLTIPDLVTCWMCCTDYTMGQNITPEQNRQAHHIAALESSLRWLLKHHPAEHERGLGFEVGDDIVLWLRNLEYLGSHPALDSLHYEQLEKLLAYKAQHLDTLKTSLDVELVDESETAWVTLSTHGVLKPRLLAVADLPDLTQLTYKDTFLVQTTMATAEACGVGPNFILTVGNDLDEQHISILLKLVENNPSWNLRDRAKAAQALQAASI